MLRSLFLIDYKYIVSTPFARDPLVSHHKYNVRAVVASGELGHK